MKPMEKVLSVIVPVYGAEAYLKKNMMTLIEQLTPKCELILVDDGSKDKSGEICDMLAKVNSNIRVVHKVNGGVSSARNAGIDIALGKYITFIDSDDFVTWDYIKTILSLIKDPADIILFGATMLDGQKEINMRPYLKDFHTLDRNELDYIYSLLFSCKSNEPWDKIYKMSIIKKLNIRFPRDVNLGEDLIFTMSYIKCVQSAKMTSKSIYCHTINAGGLGQAKVSFDTLSFHDLMFQKMLSTLDELCLEDIHYQEACEAILQIVTNYCGKLSKQGYSNADIIAEIKKHDWYEKIMQRTYCTFKNKLRKYIMHSGKYQFAALIFRH